jgi:outer membrane protein assembly factor BamB
MRTNSFSEPEWNPAGNTLKEVWRAPIGDIWASPIMAGENLFVGSGDGSFYSIDASTGKILWKLALGARIESTACIHKNTAYVGSDLGTLYAINIKNGSLLWKKSLSEYVRSSPFCDGKLVLAGSINPEKRSGMLWALTADSGSILWKRALGAVFSSPLVDQDQIFIGSDDENFYCFDLTGQARWQIPLAGKIRSTPALARDFLYIGGFGGVLYKIRRATGEIVWRNSEAGSMYSSPAVGKGIVSVGNNTGAIQFFQVNGGKKKASFETGGPVTASPLLINQFALCGSNDGHFYILDTQGKEICAFDAKSPVNSSAYMDKNTIYFGSDQGLHALSF